jgi:hypothetical protein
VNIDFAHVINTVDVAPTSDLYTAQPITFESMRRAKLHARSRLRIDLFVTRFADEAQIAPPAFRLAPPLQRSVLDVATFDRQRKLPLLADILASAYEVTEADYLVYTNVDIGLQPHFYVAVKQFIDDGHDAFVINRRTVSANYRAVGDLEMIYGDHGKAHAGWDCFIFPRRLLPRFKLHEVCIGASRVGLALLANLEAYAANFQEFADEHLTFHIGDSRDWRRPEYADYDAHNTEQVLRILAELEDEQGPFERSSIAGSFLLRQRMFGPLYDRWARNIYLPRPLSRFLNRLSGRT